MCYLSWAFKKEGVINGPRDRKFKPKDGREHKINDDITSPTVRFVGEGEPKIIATDQALRIAEERGLDLVEITPGQDPPIVKVMDYSKFRFEQLKKAKEAKKKQHIVHIKEVKVRPGIDEHDYMHKVRHARDFLESGDKVKFTMMFRGREIIHSELGMVVLKQILHELADCSTVEKNPSLEGRNMSMILVPDASISAKGKKADSTADTDSTTEDHNG
ncbi:MAG: translation initiation factor IF-3 [Spirochaetota bacterium]